MQVAAGQVGNRQVAEMEGVNILWDAEIIGMTSAFFFKRKRTRLNFKRDFPKV